MKTVACVIVLHRGFQDKNTFGTDGIWELHFKKPL